MNWTPEQNFTKFDLIHTFVSNLGSTYALCSKSQFGAGCVWSLCWILDSWLVSFLYGFFLLIQFKSIATVPKLTFFFLCFFFQNPFQCFHSASPWLQTVPRSVYTECFLGFYYLARFETFAIIWKEVIVFQGKMIRNNFHQVTGARQYSLVKQKGVVKWEVSLSKDIVQ